MINFTAWQMLQIEAALRAYDYAAIADDDLPRKQYNELIELIANAKKISVQS